MLDGSPPLVAGLAEGAGPKFGLAAFPIDGAASRLK